MGNAPLSRQPQPTERRIVVPVTTRGIFGTKLVIRPPLTHAATEEKVDQLLDSNEVEQQQFPYPSQLELAAEAATEEGGATTAAQQHVISQDEYCVKLQQLEERLSHWKAGWITMGLFGLSIAMTLSFLISYLFGVGFWSWNLLYHPAVSTGLALGLIALYVFSLKYAKHQTASLLADAQDIFRSWRSRGVLVLLKQVSTIEQTTISGQHQSSSKRESYRSGVHCFCLVISLVATTPNNNNGQEEARGGNANDAMSVGTVNTEDDMHMEEEMGIQL